MQTASHLCSLILDWWFVICSMVIHDSECSQRDKVPLNTNSTTPNQLCKVCVFFEATMNYYTIIYKAISVSGCPMKVSSKAKEIITIFETISPVRKSIHWIQVQMYILGSNTTLGQQYCAPQVRPDCVSKSCPPDHDSTFHVTEMPALTTRPSVT